MEDVYDDEDLQRLYDEEYFANRPQSERLVNKKLQLRGLDHLIRDWRVCLKEYLDHKYSSYL